MKKLLIPSLVLVSLTAGNAIANDGVLKFSHSKVKLTCDSSATCGSYTATHPIKVYRKSNGEIRLYWNLNVPADVNAGSSEAHTNGAGCPLGSTQSTLTAVWEIGSDYKPTYARATHCDGVTVSDYRITLISTGGPDCPGEFSGKEHPTKDIDLCRF